MADGPLTLRLRPFGARIALTADDERFLAAARFALGRYPTDGQLPVRVHITASTLTTTTDPIWPVTRLHETTDGLELRSGPSVVTVVRHPTATTATVELERSLLADPDATRVFVEAAFWSAAIGGGALHAVHAGLVASPTGRGALLLRGESGAGKSTLTYACLRRGMTMASDDWVYAPADRPPTRLHGYPWRMWLTVEAAARFPELATIESRPHPGSDRIKVPVAPAVGRRRRQLVPAAVVFIEPSATVGLDPVAADEARLRFRRSALDSERGSLPEEFVGALLDRPCLVLRRGPSPDDAATLLDHLARRLARSAA